MVGLTSREVQAAIALENAVRRAGALLVIDTDNVLKVVYADKISAELTRLCNENYHALEWLLRARASDA